MEIVRISPSYTNKPKLPHVDYVYILFVLFERGKQVTLVPQDHQGLLDLR